MRFLCLFLFAICLGISSISTNGAPAAVKTVIVGDPSNPGALSQELNDAYSSGARDITIRPGIYVLPGAVGSILTLTGWSDATVNAYHTTLILTQIQWNHNLWELDNCANVAIRGGITSQNEVTAYQGRVVAVSADAAGKAYADWQPDTGYPDPPASSTKFPGAVNIVDKNTHMLKVGNADSYDCPMSPLDNNRYRITFNTASLNFGVGDWIVGRYGDSPFKVHLVNCRNCTIKDVVMMRNGFANIREEGGGGNHILHCTWALGPRPTGATEEPLVTNSADGLHSTGANPGPDIEDCLFQGVLLDDCIAIHGYFTPVISGTGNQMFVATKDVNGFAVGELLRITNSTGFFQEAAATAIQDNHDGTSTVTLDRSIDVPAGSKFSAPDRDGQGYKILNNKIGGTRSRGVLVKADNGLIARNVFSNCGMSAVSIGPEFYWNEANYAHNVVVKDNVFDHNGIFGSGGACIWVHGEGAIGNRNITIENNRFVNDLQSNVQIEWADGVTIAGNRLRGELPRPPNIRVTNVIVLDNSKNITLSHNVVFAAAEFKPDLVAIGDNVTGIKNDQGIVARNR
jgi:hypothetical protein